MKVTEQFELCTRRITCVKCGLTGDDLPGIRFNFLETTPLVCEQCIYKLYTGKKLDWNVYIKKSLELKEKD